MRRILERFIRGDHRPKDFMLVTMDDIKKRYRGEIAIEDSAQLENKIIEINFDEHPEFRDPNEAVMCVVVLTSDGKRGTLTHLTMDKDPTEFVKSLKQKLGTPCPVCLSGGEDGISEGFVEKLVAELRKQEFFVSTEPGYSDLHGQNIYRRATLNRDGVKIIKESYSGGREIVELRFPSA